MSLSERLAAKSVEGNFRATDSTGARAGTAWRTEARLASGASTTKRRGDGPGRQRVLLAPTRAGAALVLSSRDPDMFCAIRTSGLREAMTIETKTHDHALASRDYLNRRILIRL